MSQQVVLQGGGPFTANDELDAQILRAHPGYVAVLPTAEAFENPDDLVQLSVAWAKRLACVQIKCAGASPIILAKSSSYSQRNWFESLAIN